MKRVRDVLIAGLTVLMLMTLAPGAMAGNLVFTNFDGPGSNAGGTTINAINNTGAVVGFSSDNASTPTLFTNFVRNPNGTFSLLNLNGDPLANANGINDSNVVVGLSSNNAFPFEFNAGVFTTLPAANPGNTNAEVAFGINNAGIIVGQYADNTTGTAPGFVFAAGAFAILNPVSNDLQVFAQGINNNGLVAGFFNTDGVHDHGFLFNTNGSTYTLLADPNVPNLVLTQFLGINDHNEAVGYYQTNDGSQHGFLYDIATHSYTFVDDPNAAKSGLSITQITGISNSGEIAGFYVDANSGHQRGFVASPAVTVPASVPEPGSALILLGLGAMFATSRAERLAKRNRSQPQGDFVSRSVKLRRGEIA